ncbi:MAG: phosphopantetheine-binding protein [Alphaproteobacteria bacterium]|nr:phosphopantetheine-binding protein [Alphaproteobacteria bacterium]
MIQSQIDEILDIVAQKAMIERHKLTLDAKLADLNISSLDMVEVIFALEDKLGIDMQFNANVNIGEFSTLGDIVSVVDKQLSVKK